MFTVTVNGASLWIYHNAHTLERKPTSCDTKNNSVNHVLQLTTA